MKNGWHDHFCEKCGFGFVCPKVTHCKDPFETLCPDHCRVEYNSFGHVCTRTAGHSGPHRQDTESDGQ